MKKLLIFIAICAIVLPSCGAKKNVATNVESTPGETEANEVVTSADTLPEFLREFANDSTIHINWAYGIPFIIDDSVPMYLPPIDKNPEEYVSSGEYKKHIWNPQRVSYYWGAVLPLDTILWLNKVVCELEEFTFSFERGFQYIYYIYYIPTDNNHALVEIEILAVRTAESPKDGKTKHYKYYFSSTGDMIGKCGGKFNNAKSDAFFAEREEKRIILTYIRHTVDFETWLNAH